MSIQLKINKRQITTKAQWFELGLARLCWLLN